MKAFLILYMIFGVVLIIIGCVFLTRRKFLYRKFYNMLVLLVLLLIQAVRPWVIYPYDGTVPYWVLYLYPPAFLILVLVFAFLMKNEYSIINVDGNMVKTALISVLEEEGVPFRTGGEKILLENDRRITYRAFLNSVDISFKGVGTLPWYGRVREEFTRRIKGVELTVFPSAAVFCTIIGLAMAVVMAFVWFQL